MTAPASAHGSFRRAPVVVRVDTPGGRLEHPLDRDDEDLIAARSAQLLNLVAEPLRSASTVTVIRQPQGETP